ncbi:MAG: hypothetical protein JST42_13270 [Bacteroidetes bacterium]|nr:hypothetical protein [Bacteroidota bacterium]
MQFRKNPDSTFSFGGQTHDLKKLRPYLSVLGAFAVDLARLGRRVARQLILPGRRGSGNLLSSLFLLFTGLAEDAIVFRRALIRMPLASDIRLPVRDRLDRAWAYSKRWLRLGVIAAAWVLFILSSLEWSGPEAPAVSDQPATAAMAKNADTVVIAAAVDARALSLPVDTAEEPVLPVTPRQGAPLRRWLRLCTLRI